MTIFRNIPMTRQVNQLDTLLPSDQQSPLCRPSTFQPTRQERGDKSIARQQAGQCVLLERREELPR